MREIKFRGRDKRYDGTWEPWMYGSLDLSDLWPAIIENGPPLSVKSETIGQYTGLKDKNGTEIYEGDVLRFSWMRGFHLVESFHVVRFCENAAAFKFWDGQTWCPFWGFSDEDMEVVGNIFDDPEFNERFGTPYREL